jgi:antitoxin component YwqK of YwqJK toxin-antitoxin module
MEVPYLPTDICVVIALTRPDAYSKLIQTCRVLRNRLAAFRDTLLVKWIPRKVHDTGATKVYANICPNGWYHGEYKIVDNAANQIIEVRNYQFGVLHGNWYHIENRIYRTSCTYVNGKIHGVMTYKGGGYNMEMERTQYVNGLKHGLSVEKWISGGKSCEREYKNDVLDGKATYWEVDGRRVCCRENYSRGYLHGDRTFYDEKGNIVRSEVWDMGYLHKIEFSAKKWRRMTYRHYRIKFES